MKKILLALIVPFLVVSCVDDNFAPEYARPVADSDVTVWSMGIPDFSGVVLSFDKTFLWGLSNSEGIYKLDLNGNIIEHTLAINNDFEGITMDRNNGNIYLVEETYVANNHNSNTIYQFFPATKELKLIFQVDIPNSTDNKGLEGIAVVGDELWVGNQDDPKIVMKYSLSSKKITGSLTLPWAGFINDLAYDPDDNSLWMSDTEKDRLVNFRKDGSIIKTFATKTFISKPEGVALDKDRNCIWLSCDATGQLAKMKYDFTK
ncbi:MAG: SdiA-regulated domain-containing protein [Bacteroidales bacterium]|nr:SdiA-regulated domain-containing protein [Bacteroidales bacterium]MBR5055957.1 SdiA-regulated domain-containing protein [Bacteroidales bacterium]